MTETTPFIQQYYAEMDTDKIIRENYFSDLNNGIMVEVGGATPEYISMSRHFKINNWRCIIIEPNPKFVEQHKNIGNEVYQYACSYEDVDNTNFEIVHHHVHDGILDDHSFSAIKIKESYLNACPGVKYTVTNITINVRKLDTILNELSIDKIDFLSVDVEGWELEVMKGFDVNKFMPKVILLENFVQNNSYTEYMNSVGYRLDRAVGYNHIFVR